MPDETYRLPDGSVLTIPDSATPAQLTALFNKLSTDFPDSIGRAWSTYGQEEEEEDEGNIFGALYQAVENLPLVYHSWERRVSLRCSRPIETQP